jgi:peptide/nickel transport system substrate-binding protein
MRKALLRCAGLVAFSAVVAGCSGSQSLNGTPGATVGRSVDSGGTVTFAEPPGAPPNYIFPLTSGAYFDTNNLQEFSQNLYLPLYWFGDKGSPVVNPSLSVAKAPVFSNNNTVVTVTLKHWVWSNGQPITARDVIFWMNLLGAASDPNAPAVGSSSSPGPGWGSEVPGGFPQNVVSYRQTGTYTVVFHLNASYNPDWFEYDELSQITPIPQASWDKLSMNGSVGNFDTSAQTTVALPNTSPTEYVPADPGTATTGALGVAQFLNLQSQDLATYDSDSLWKVVDGPFRLSEFTTEGFVKMVPNKDYSGSPKPKISAFEELPFTSTASEFAALSSGSLTIGYIPFEDLAAKVALEKSQGYKFSPWVVYNLMYFPYNFTNATVGPILRQLYFRQAFQSLIDQSQYIKEFLHGDGSVTIGTVPTSREHAFESPLEVKGKQVYPYDPSKAVTLLKANGWKVVPGGTTTCQKVGAAPGDCGAGVTANQPLTFNLIYASGTEYLTNEVDAMQSAMKSAAGIQLNVSTQPLTELYSAFVLGCTIAKPCNNWEMAYPGGGWTYSNPGSAYATGQEQFTSGADGNPGDYSYATANALIQATLTAPTTSAEQEALDKYQDYLAKQLPVAFMPEPPYQLTMYKSDLKGLVPQGIDNEIYPQDYYFTK